MRLWSRQTRSTSWPSMRTLVSGSGSWALRIRSSARISASERVRRGSVVSSLLQCCRSSVVRVTAELLIEGMRADAPLEARLVERPLQLGGGFGGGEVEDRSGGGGDGDAVAAGDVLGVEGGLVHEDAGAAAAARRSRASGPLAVGASPRERRLGKRTRSRRWRAPPPSRARAGSRAGRRGTRRGARAAATRCATRRAITSLSPPGREQLRRCSRPRAAARAAARIRGSAAEFLRSRDTLSTSQRARNSSPQREFRATATRPASVRDAETRAPIPNTLPHQPPFAGSLRKLRTESLRTRAPLRELRDDRLVDARAVGALGHPHVLHPARRVVHLRLGVGDEPERADRRG